MNIFQRKLNKDSGFVILFAVLISTLILLMSAGIFRVIQKERVLSSYSRESQIAYYAADAGVECAVYHDLGDLIETSRTLEGIPNFGIYRDTSFPDSDNTNPPRSLECTTNTEPTLGSSDGSIYDVVYSFRYLPNGENLGCALVFVEKDNYPTGTIKTRNVRITAIGYNRCDGDGEPDIDDPSLLERRLSINYTES